MFRTLSLCPGDRIEDGCVPRPGGMSVVTRWPCAGWSDLQRGSRLCPHRLPSGVSAKPLGLTEREAEDHADRQGSLDGQVRVGPLTAGPPGGRRLPGIQRGFGEPDREGAPLLESRFLVSPVPHPVPGLGVLVLAALGIPHSPMAPGSGRGIVKMPSHPEPCTNAILTTLDVLSPNNLENLPPLRHRKRPSH